MRKLLSFNLLIALAVVFASCGTNNNVVNNRLISKRKFNKGFHINSKGNMKSSNDKKQEESIAFDDSKKREGYNKKIERRNQERAEKNAAVENTTAANYEATQERTSQSENNATPRTSDSQVSDNVIADLDEQEDRSEDIGNDVKEQKTETQKKSSNKNRGGDSGVRTILLVILALFIAPLSVFIYEGATNRFWITLVLWLVGLGVGYFLFGGTIAWLCGLVAAIYAILIVLGVI